MEWFSMIVCVCHAVSDREIRASTELGIASFDQLQDALGVGTCCGQCVDCAREILGEHLELGERAQG
jgi:bacterioferritin-associated ferredoxin